MDEKEAMSVMEELQTLTAILAGVRHRLLESGFSEDAADSIVALLVQQQANAAMPRCDGH